jgi:predicted component of type VI protein secretion system
MKFSLTVLSAGAMQGKVISIGLAQFLIGRGRECNLRPASPLISKRHCALLTRGGKVFVKDFASTNGTFLNDEAIKEECELKDDDCLKVGPLAFRINLKYAPSVSESRPLPVSKAVVGSEDEEAAALLLAMQDNESSSPASNDQEEGEGPSSGGSTIVESSQNLDTSPELTPLKSGAEKREAAAGAAAVDTAAAAKAILDKYIRRPRH